MRTILLTCDLAKCRAGMRASRMLGLQSDEPLATKHRKASVSISSTKLRAVIALALFTFSFLATEFRFDIAMGVLAGPEAVVGAQALILGASVIGFVGYGFVGHRVRGKLLLGASAAMAIAGIAAAELAADPFTLQALGCVAFLAFGLLGGAAHTRFALTFESDPKLATGAGSAYAAGILLQFACNLVIPAGIVEGIVLITGTIALAAVVITLPQQAEISSSTVGDKPTAKRVLAQPLWSAALIAVLACMFSTLDNVVTLSNAQGIIAVQTWPRLFLAASGLVAGILFDLAERRYMGFIMFAMTALSTISILAVEAGASPVLGLIVFYLSSGFFVTFFTSLFTQLAPRTQRPHLWAGMGRATNNLCAFTISSVSLALATSGNVALIMIAAVVLFVAASGLFVAGGLFRLPQSDQERRHLEQAERALDTPSIDEQRISFIEVHALTPRETDVLIAVTADERPLKQVADDLGISLRMVQRHLTSIYQKTGTQTRAGLTKAFPS